MKKSLAVLALAALLGSSVMMGASTADAWWGGGWGGPGYGYGGCGGYGG